MPDVPANNQMPEPTYMTVNGIADLTNRNPQMIRRYIRKGIIEAIQDPTDGRRQLLDLGQVPVILRQAHAGYELREVNLHTSTGGIITITPRVPKETA